MPTNDPALPDPKERPVRSRYRRQVASASRWARIIDAKLGPCRVCGASAYNGGAFPKVQFHHVVLRIHGGDDLPDNIVPLCLECHDRVTRRKPDECEKLLAELEPAEYAYMVERGGEDYPERAYGIRYSRA